MRGSEYLLKFGIIKLILLGVFLLWSKSLISQCSGGSLCQVCSVDLQITSITGGTIIQGTSLVNGSVNGGQTGNATSPLQIAVTDCGEIELTVELDFIWDQGNNINWIHGVSFETSNGWSAAQEVLPGPGWIFKDSITGACSNVKYDAGYFYDPPGTGCPPSGNNSNWNGTNCINTTYCEATAAWLTDGEPFDNYGVDCEFGCPEFGFNLKYCPEAAGNNTEDIGFLLTDDGESGGWRLDAGCVFQLNFPIEFVSAGTQLRDTLIICENTCTDLDPGPGCDSYMWSTGQTTQIINVCPLVTTEYYVTATSGSGCEIIDTVTVIPEFCCEADAGTITGATNCPGVPTLVNVTGYQMGADYDQYILILDENGIIIEVIPGDMATVNSDTCGVFEVVSYNHYLFDASPIPTIGVDTASFDCVNNCCDLEVNEVNFEDHEAPVFPTTPPDETLECVTELTPATSLGFTDNCLLPGMVDPVETGSADLCNGGSITRTWTAVDSCGNSTEHVQVITVDPLEPPVFINLPSDETFDCSYTVGTVPDLFYENTLTGLCLIQGSVPGVLTGSHDNCGGSYSITWDYVDTCMNPISHTQVITIDPASEATYINPPPSETIDCNAVPSSFPDLTYDNGETGICNITGLTPPVTVSVYDECGGTITNTWEDLDPCGRTISYVQVITINPAPPAVFTSTLPMSMTVACDMVPAAPGDLNVSNSETGTCEITDVVSPVVTDNSDPCGGSIEYTWDFADNCGRSINHVQTITISPAPPPTFVNPPVDITVDCDNIPLASTNLTYDNGLTGSCQLTNTVLGTLTAFDVCTGVMTETWEDVDDCGLPIMYSRTITVEPIDPIVFASTPADMTVSCDNVPATFPNLDYSNNSSGPCLKEGSAPAVVSGSFTECGGVLVISWTGTDVCGASINESQNITVDPAPVAVFDPAPADITVTCDNVPAPSPLNYTNGLSNTCDISGDVLPVQLGVYDACGGNISFQWEFTDECGRTINEEQNITVDPAPEANWISPPGDITIDCSDVASLQVNLNFTNGLTNPCLISGSIAAINSGSYDQCGGSILQSWSYIDPCDRPINHQRNVTINPAPPPAFVNPPEDITLDCGVAYSDPPDLVYTNGESAPCDFNGSVSADVENVGIEYTHTWEFVNDCDGIAITHVQVVTVSPFPEISIDPVEANICFGESYDLGNIVVTDMNNTNITVEFYEGFPSSPNNLVTNLVVSPATTTIYTVLAINEYGCTDEVPFSLITDEPPYAGTDGMTSICSNVTLNFFNFLGSSYQSGGVWIDSDMTGVNLDDPTSVTISNLPPGSYDFTYQVESGNSCPPDEAVLTVVFNDLPDVVIDSIFCTNSNAFYSVTLVGGSYLVLADHGVVVDLGGGNFVIEDIPITNSVTITLYDAASMCGNFVVVNPPDCDCPQVPLPTVEDVSICQDEAPITLLAIAAAGTTLNWYDVETDGTALIVDSDSYTSPETTAGSYTYYVESESIEFPGCVSSIRVPITLNLVNSPVVSDPSPIEYCVNQAESITIDLTQFNNAINQNPNNTFNYYDNFNDLQSQVNTITEIEIFATDSIYVEVINVNGCISTIGFQIEINLNPILVTSVEDESCEDADDGQVSIVLSPPSDHYEIDFEGEIQYDFSVDSLMDGSYVVYAIDTITNCSIADTFEIGEGTILDNVVLDYICDNGGTDTDPDDDFYDLTFHFTQQNSTATQYELFVDGTSEGTFDFDLEYTISIDVNANPITIMIVDLVNNCTWEQQIGPLNPCSTNCSLSLLALSQVCSDQNTPSDPSDDVHVFTLEVTAINGSSAGTYNVLINSIPQFTFNYDELVNFEWSADGTTPIVLLVDSEDIQCTLPITIEPLLSCSDECLLEIIDINYICSDGGTEDQIDDDFYTVTIELLILNGSSGNTVEVAIDNDAPIQFMADNIEFTIPANEQEVWIYINDLNLLSCSDSIFIGPLDPCSSNCSLDFEYIDYSCNDSGTPFDSSDDFYDFEWILHAIEGSPDSSYLFYLDDVFIDFYSYSDQVNYIIGADGEVHTLEFIDALSQFCNLSFDTDPLMTCSDSCLLVADVNNIICNNNGSNNTELDDQFYFDLTVNANNGSAQWIDVVTGNLYAYGSAITFGPYQISDGQVSIQIQDEFNLNCPITIDVDTPMPCSECVQTADAGADQIIDCDFPVATLVGTSSEIGTYSWDGPSGNVAVDSVASANQEGWYYFSVLYPDGCSLLDSLYIEAIGEIPLAIAGPDTMLTCAIQNAILTGTFVSTSQDLSFIWRDEDGVIVSEADTVFVTSSGSYTFQVIDNVTGCESSPDEIFVALDIEEPLAVIYADPGDILNCKIDLINLTTDEEINTIYQWIDDGESTYTTSYVVSSAGTIVLVAIDTLTGCQASDSIFIDRLEEFPLINISPFGQLDCDSESVELSAANTIPASTSLFTWSDSDNMIISQESTIDVSDAGIYYLEVQDTVTGCINMDTIQVDILENYPIFSSSDDLELPCNQMIGELSVSVSSGASSILWSTMNGTILGANNNSEVNIEGEGVYFVEVTDDLTGCVTNDTIYAFEVESDIGIVDLEKVNETCQDENDGSFTWVDIEGAVEPYEVYLNGDLQTQTSFENLSPANYFLEIIDANGCSYDTSFTIETGTFVNAFTDPLIEINEGENGLIEIETNVPESEISSIVWTPSDYLSCDDCLSAIATPPSDITYTITITDINGCETTVTVSLVVRESIKIYVPNVFSPDNDGLNDNFTIYSQDIEEIELLQIYDRWGELVFTNSNFAASQGELGWDGTFRGKDVNPAVFSYYALVRLKNGQTEKLVGDVTVLR